MQKYIEIKVGSDTPMTNLEYNKLRGWELPSDEDGNVDGYLVEYVDSKIPNHPDYSNYITWLPKSVFDSAHQANPNFSFGTAIELLKKGYKVARSGWNGKNMYLILIKAGNARYQGFEMQDCIGMKTVAEEMQPGWLASQADMLADDWSILE